MPACSGLIGWDRDDHAAALAAYAATVDLLGPDWPRHSDEDPKAFFETRFLPQPPVPALLTGYYEPELSGTLAPSPEFRYPLHSAPPDLSDARVWHSRAEIEENSLLRGRELVWLDSAIEAFLAQVQGSVRVRLAEGGVLRLGFAAKNGHPYHSIGQELVRRGAVAEANMSADAIREWCKNHPSSVPALLRHNPSYVFFRVLELPGSSGPLGSMGRPLTAMRSLAADRAHIPAGAPVWVETDRHGRLMVAQDTGSAITGKARADLFCGSGFEAGKCAGEMRDSGRLVTFLPRKLVAGGKT
ncbi:MAG: MltA domain-containing protein [Paracoccaceae bacterium]